MDFYFFCYFRVPSLAYLQKMNLNLNYAFLKYKGKLAEGLLASVYTATQKDDSSKKTIVIKEVNSTLKKKDLKN